jgi:hypothetical protein
VVPATDDGPACEELIVTNTPPPSNNNDHAPAEPGSPAEPTQFEPTPAAPTQPEPVTTEPAFAEPVEAELVPEEPVQEEPIEDEPVELVEPEPPAEATPAAVQQAQTEQVVAPAEAPLASDAIPETVGYEEHVEESRPTGEQTIAPPAAPVVQTVYVTPPTPPKKKGNRGYGILFAFLGLIVFALLVVGVMALVLNAMFPGEMVDRIVGFVNSTAFIVPVAVFFVAFVLLVLISNRATWWAYVLGSFLVALAVYFGSIGVILLMANVFGMTPDAAAAGFVSLATSPALIVAAVLAREVTIWFGAAVASRGRKVTERNLEARAAYERELDSQPIGFA